MLFRSWKRDTIFNKGPLSLGHARLAQDCRACHADAQTDVLKARLSDSHGRKSLPTMVSATFSTGKNTTGSTHGAGEPAMDKACLACHPGFASHAPQPASLMLAKVSHETVSVGVQDCFVCHREHTGSARMALPDAAQCAACHASTAELAKHREVHPTGKPAPAAAQNVNLGDGLLTFIAAADPKRTPAAFSDFAHGHPAFAYEGQKDPAKIKFNHARHQIGRAHV